LALQHHHLGGDRSGLAQDFQRREDFAAQREFAALLVIRAAQQVGAEADLDTRVSHEFHAADGLLPGVFGLFLALGSKPQLRAEFYERRDDDHGRHDVGPLVGDKARGFGIDQGAVLDATHAELHAAADRAGGMAVGSDIGAPLDALVDDGADLVFTILVHPDRIGGRRHTARAHDLDAVRALAQLFARGLDALVHTVGHDGHRVENRARTGADRLIPRRFLDWPEIAVAARHRQDLARVEEARTDEQPVSGCFVQPVIAAANIAYRGESALQRVREHAQRMRGAIGLAHCLYPLDDYVACKGMDVRINHSWHECAALGIDDLRIGRADGPGRQVLNAAVRHQQAHTFRAFG